jgi:dihydrodipicolinate synthase/N-acetylneuraminate lyase
MLYNNPPAYRVSIDFDTLARLAPISNIVALKESAPDPRRFTDIINRFGERFTLLAGLDDVALEGLLLGARGWVSGLTSAFPRESVAMVAAALRGDWTEARRIYRWSCRCCTWMPTMTWCSPSSWPNSSWAAARARTHAATASRGRAARRRGCASRTVQDHTAYSSTWGTTRAQPGAAA